MPATWPENIEVLELWGDVNTQWRAGGMGVVGLDYREVRKRADELDIDMSPCVWRKIKMLENKVLEKQYKSDENPK